MHSRSEVNSNRINSVVGARSLRKGGDSRYSMHLHRFFGQVYNPAKQNCSTSRVVKEGSVVRILRVLTKQGGDDEKTGSVSSEIR
jgi:hypothetical protein